MKALLIGALFLCSCVSVDEDEWNNQRRSVHHLKKQVAELESQHDHLQYRLDVETYRRDMRLCGRNRQCRVNTYRAWKLLLQEHDIWSAK